MLTFINIYVENAKKNIFVFTFNICVKDSYMNVQYKLITFSVFYYSNNRCTVLYGVYTVRIICRLWSL